MDTNSFWSALLGGFFALLGVIITLYFGRKHAQEDERKQELAFASSIRCELACFQDLMEKRQEELIKGIVGPSGIIEKQYFINQNYLSFFDQNMVNISKLSRQDIKLSIQKLILYSKAYFDTIHAHNSQIEEITKKAPSIGQNLDTKEVSEYYTMLQIFKEFETELIALAKEIYVSVITLQKELDHY